MRRFRTSSNPTSGADVRAFVVNKLAGGKPDTVPQGSDRALAHRLLRETVVWRSRLDRALSEYCRRPLNSLDRKVLWALRCGAAQLIILKTPSYAAVSSTVGALKGHRGKGLVNAVLRKLANKGEPNIKSAPAHVAWSHPQDLVKRWMERFGKPETLKLLEWNNSVPDIGGCFPEETCSKDGVFLKRYGIIDRTGASLQYSLPNGVYVQDEAAAIVGKAVAELACGGSVLELAAAPGGKTHHIQKSAAETFSVDISLRRMEMWIENSSRLHWTGVFPAVAEGSALPFRGEFDLVLVDAPCSNTGVYRRRHDARWKWSGEYLEDLLQLQRKLLESASKAVRPGGVLVYSTCSLEEEENRQMVLDFLRDFPGFLPVDLPVPKRLKHDGMMRAFPPRHGIDGLFAAALKRSE